MNPGNNAFPTELDQLIDFAFPEAVAVEGIRHSDEAFTIVVLDVNLSQTVWLAALSLDHRWTLSPRPNAKVVEVPDMP